MGILKIIKKKVLDTLNIMMEKYFMDFGKMT
jgi:hypothetical protein